MHMTHWSGYYHTMFQSEGIQATSELAVYQDAVCSWSRAEGYVRLLVRGA